MTAAPVVHAVHTTQGAVEPGSPCCVLSLRVVP